MEGISLMLRCLGGRRSITAASLSSAASSLNGTLVVSSAAATYCTLAFSDDVFRPLYNAAIVSTVSFNFPSTFHINHSRSFSAASSGPSKMVSIDTEEQLNDSLRKAQDDSMPAIFYFTAVWCGPCKLITPYMGQLSEKYPHVAMYKIDIDKGDLLYLAVSLVSVAFIRYFGPIENQLAEGLSTALSKLNINAVPTIHFFHKGKKASEVVGADVNKLSSTMKDLYE